MLIISLIFYLSVILLTIITILKIKNNQSVKKSTIAIVFLILPMIVIVFYVLSIITLPKYLVMSTIGLINTYLPVIVKPALFGAIGAIIIIITGIKAIKRKEF